MRNALLRELTGSITKVPLAEGGRDVLVYTTISGAVGALIPFISSDDVDFMQTLEMVSCRGGGLG